MAKLGHFSLESRSQNLRILKLEGVLSSYLVVGLLAGPMGSHGKVMAHGHGHQLITQLEAQSETYSSQVVFLPADFLLNEICLCEITLFFRLSANRTMVNRGTSAH